MEVIKLHGDYLNENTYILPFSGECVIIDPGANIKRLNGILGFLKLKCVAALLTHGHFDHIVGAKGLQDAGAKIYIHKDADLMVNSSGNLAKLIGMECERFRGDFIFEGDCNLTVAGIGVKVIETPGHSDGGVCYQIENMLFTGDTLFAGSYGATHFHTGDFMKLKHSIVDRLFILDDEIKVYCGHDTAENTSDIKIINPMREYLVYASCSTTLAREKANNPILYGF